MPFCQPDQARIRGEQYVEPGVGVNGDFLYALAAKTDTNPKRTRGKYSQNPSKQAFDCRFHPTDA